MGYRKEDVAHLLLLHYKSVVSDVLTDFLEDMEYRGLISEMDKEEYYDSLSTDLNLVDLIHPQPKPNGAFGMTIVQRMAGKKISDKVIAELVKRWPESMSVAFVEDPKALTVNVIRAQASEKFEEFLKLLEGVDATFFFDRKVYEKEEDQQPFEILNIDGKPSLVAFVTSENNVLEFVKEYLIPEISDMVGDTDNDLPELIRYLKKPRVCQRFLKELGGDSSTLTLVFHNGEAITYEIADKAERKDFEWGSISDYYPSGGKKEPEEKPEEKAEPVAAAPKKKLSLVEQLKAAEAGKTASSGSSDGTVTQDGVTKSAPEFNKDKAAERAAKSVEADLLVFPPEEVCASKSSLNNWYTRGWNIIPTGSEIALTDSKKAIGLPLLSLNDKLKTNERYQIRRVATPTGDKGKDTGPRHVPTETRNNGYPVIPASQKEAVTKQLATLDLKSQEIMGLDKLAEIEKKRPNFWDTYPAVDRVKFTMKVASDDGFLVEMVRNAPESFLEFVRTIVYERCRTLATEQAKIEEVTDKEAASTPAAKSGNLFDALKKVGGGKTAA